MTELASWVVEAWVEELKNVLQFLTGDDWSAEAAPESAPAAASYFWWTQYFNIAPNAGVAIGAPPLAWSELGARILQAAGVELIEQSSARATYLEAIQQSTSALARALTEKAGRHVEAAAGREGLLESASAAFTVTLSSGESRLHPLRIVVDNALTGAIVPSTAVAPSPRVRPAPPVPSDSGVPSRGISLLLDVQMPISISFGKASMQLRDVLKLTAGSAVELDRRPDDEVDVVVNNCVIAKGEVVVIDGNYGVRITSIISREQRLALRAGGRL